MTTPGRIQGTTLARPVITPPDSGIAWSVTIRMSTSKKNLSSAHNATPGKITWINFENVLRKMKDNLILKQRCFAFKIISNLSKDRRVKKCWKQLSPICFSFGRRDKLKRHVDNVHSKQQFASDVQKPFICELCNNWWVNCQISKHDYQISNVSLENSGETIP